MYSPYALLPLSSQPASIIPLPGEFKLKLRLRRTTPQLSAAAIVFFQALPVRSIALYTRSIALLILFPAFCI